MSEHHLASEMKDQIAGAVKEKEKIAEGKAAFDAKKPDMFKEIEPKAKEKEEIAKGKKEYLNLKNQNYLKKLNKKLIKNKY